ncbi:MAG TPA: alpha-glucuronidase family glycosyl hydrolase [Chitinophagaceae bacterium]|jgi:alpha-glucuronidase|nr:alpha-glucuronidase family glycosyl hydrolase [Chitinophagaceae bacterium]
MKKMLPLLFFVLLSNILVAEDGYDLWLRYKMVTDQKMLAQYRQAISSIVISGNSPTLLAAKEEAEKGLTGLLGKKIPLKISLQQGSVLICAAGDPVIVKWIARDAMAAARNDGFLIRTLIYDGKKITLVTGNTDAGVLYGTFHLLRLLQTNQPIGNLNIISSPSSELRLLNHWDNLDRHVERGYAGISIWNWHQLPGYPDKRYKDYARANASIGINGTSLTNVNANAMVLTKAYLEKAAALADIFRPYGIKVYLTARFSAPIEIGGLKTADPLNDTVRQWWKDKVKEIYEWIPDFGGFLVKANSEGQPGPQNYGRDHADGANMLADAVAPYNGIVMWRAFVYSQQSNDRFKQAYEEFKLLDGKFRKNVLVQVKNGPIDFQPREPFSPLFGSMEQTPLMMEFQLTQEYLGQGTHLVYEAPMFKEVLDADTYKKGKGTEVYRTINGMAGVSNIGNERNWTGHPFGQANWYAFGRLAWDHSLSSEQIAGEWIRMTFTNDAAFVTATKKIMLASHETMVNYMTPLGLHHIMGNGHHYGPAPWSDNLPRPDWNPVYYHRADAAGIGFDRTTSGTNALAQYAVEVRRLFEDPSTCDEKYLLWFHHVSWQHKMRSGRTLWEELCYKYYKGVAGTRLIGQQWDQLGKYIDEERFRQVQLLLAIQVKEATWWRNACLLYFQEFSKMPLPAGDEKPDQSLDYYKSLRFPYAPGN